MVDSRSGGVLIHPKIRDLADFVVDRVTVCRSFVAVQKFMCLRAHAIEQKSASCPHC